VLIALALAVALPAPALAYDELQNWLGSYGRTVQHLTGVSAAATAGSRPATDRGGTVQDREPEQALEHDVDELEHDAEQLEQHIDEAREDWEHKQDDPRVPGAVPDPDDDEDKPQAAQSERGEAADEAGQ
jgi:hypothetical protein